MKKLLRQGMRVGLVFLATACIAAAEASAAPAPVTLRCDWAAYLGAHDPQWETLPVEPFDAPIIGTGASGTYLIQDQDSGELRFEMSRNDLCDVRRDFRVRKPNGWFRLRLPGGKPAGKCRLDLYHAQIEADLKSGENAWKLSAFAVPGRDVILFEIERTAGSADGPEWNFVPDSRMPEGTACPTLPKEMKPYPPQTRATLDGCFVSIQDMPVDKAYHTEKEPAASQHAVAWRVATEGGRTCVFAAVAISFRAATAARDAVDRVNRAFEAGFDTVRQEHRAWWQAYYAKSFVSLPPAFERWHCLQLYKVASMTNPDSITDLCGPWFDINMVWNGIWFNFNTEKMYSSVFTVNHPDLADAVLNFLWKHRETLHDKASDGYSQFWGAVSAHTGDCGCGTRPGDPACLAWLLSLAYERYQCTMDSTLLLEKAVPLMVGAVNYYKKHLLVAGADGRIHIKAIGSPEFQNAKKKYTFEDSTYGIAGIRWLCRTLISIHQRYGVPSQGVGDYQELLKNLTPYCIDPQEGFMIGKDQPFNHAHRHDSHELAIWPYLEYLPSDPAQAMVIRNTMATHKRFGFEPYPCMADAAWALFSAMLERGDDAAAMLASIFPKSTLSPHTTRNVQLRSGKLLGYCEEGPFWVHRAIEELLLQSWGDGVIRVFPAVPASAEWNEVAFHDFLAKGAFLVSARRSGGATRFIQVRSLAGEPCQVRTGMAGPLRILSDCNAALADRDNGIVEIKGLGRGHWCVLYSGDAVPELVISPTRSQR